MTDHNTRETGDGKMMLVLDILDAILKIAANIIVGALALTVGLAVLAVPGWIIVSIFPELFAAVFEEFQSPIPLYGFVGLGFFGISIALYALGMIIRDD